MYSLHNHSDYSNGSRSFADSSMKIEDMIIRAKELGLEGIAITDHEIIGGHVKAKQLEKKHDFNVLLGNEIYMVTPTQDEILRENYDSSTMYYPHFLLIALDEIGHQQLRKLSTLAWEDAYTQKGLIRTTTLTTDVEEVIGKNKGHVVASTACLGGAFAKNVLAWIESDDERRLEWIGSFIEWGKDTFGEGNFYLEAQPAREDGIEQWQVNKAILDISKQYSVPYIITTDSHYLKRENLNIHKAFLHSDKGGDREVEAFYATTYLMSIEEIKEYFYPHWTEKEIAVGIENTRVIGRRAKRFTFSKTPDIPRAGKDEWWEGMLDRTFFPNKKYMQKMLSSDSIEDQYLMYKLEKGIRKLIPEKDYEETFDKIEEELIEVWHVSEKLNDKMSAYFNTISKIIDVMWNEGDSFVGTGRGSVVVSMIAYLCEITQINPLKMPVDLPFYRFMTQEREDYLDIDVDSQHDRRDMIFEALKKEWEKINGDVINCSTYSTLTSKSAVQTACRGLNIDIDIAQSLSNLIPVVRGFVRSIKETYYGDKENDIKPIKEFVNIVDSHEGLLETILLIEGLIINRSIHAGGVFFVNGDISEYNAIMKSPSGVRSTQWDLHDSEKFGLMKFDLLTTKGMSKIRKTIDLLIEDGYIERKDTLKETYMSVIDPMTLQYDTPKTWELIANNEVMDLFQFSTDVSKDVLKVIQPKNVIQLFQSNSLLRLQQQEDAHESPVETYVRFKNDLQLAYDEMNDYEVPKKDQQVLENILKKYYFVADTQEIVMELLKNENLLGFSIADTHKGRKSIGKKSKEDQEALRKNVFETAKKIGLNKNTAKYIWEVQISRQLGYAFSIPHVVAYTFIALQELFLYQNYPSVYWDTACLTINAGAEDNQTSDKKTSTQYGKIAKAISDMKSFGKDVSLPYINKSGFGFTPSPDDNSIIFGLKGISNIGDDFVHDIIENRPYKSLNDFYEKAQPKKVQLIYLIKSGAFDRLYPDLKREEVMKQGLGLIANNELQNNYKSELPCFDGKHIDSISKMNIVDDKHQIYIRYINFEKYVTKKNEKIKIGRKVAFKLDDISKTFFEEHFSKSLKKNTDYWYEDDSLYTYNSPFQKECKKRKETFMKYINTKVFVDKYNEMLYNNNIDENLQKYCEGSISTWEMDSISFYHHDHELKNIKKDKYNVNEFLSLSEEPKHTLQKGKNGREWKRYELNRIAGTVLDTNKTKHIVYLLTTDGVVNVKFYDGAFVHYNKTISKSFWNEKKEKYQKTTLESSWFKRGTKLIVTGFRKGDYFFPKNYWDSPYSHTVSKVEEIHKDGTLILSTERVKI